MTKERKVVVTSLRLGLIATLFFVAAMTTLLASDELFPKPSSSALPTYPERARTARVAGSVKLWFVLNREGEVAQSGIISGNPLLRDAAAYTVASWKFPPNVLQPNVRLETEFIYVLNVQQKEGEPRLTVSMTDFRRIEITSELYVKPIE